jgi:hypothetical protein
MSITYKTFNLMQKLVYKNIYLFGIPNKRSLDRSNSNVAPVSQLQKIKFSS